MKEDLDPILASHITKLSNTSRDGEHKEKMTQLTNSVINFDKIPAEYSRRIGLPTLPKSVDALFISEDNQWFFIEFKNGNVDKCDIHRKIYDSIIMLIELGIIENFDFLRKNGTYILVYNSDHYGNTQSPSRSKVYEHVKGRANEEISLFELKKLEKYLLKSTHTYKVDEFEDFVNDNF